MPTTYGSVLFQDYLSHRDATIVTRLKEAGAVILAKTTMGEFSFRYVGSGSRIVRNAYDPNRNPSGSSSGTGTRIAANFGLVGIGQDTGGSVRGPAAVSNLVGLRPTPQLISRYGAMPVKPRTQDTLGPMTRTVTDAARLLDVIAGYDPKDPMTVYSVSRTPESYTAYLMSDQLRGARIGVIRMSMDSEADPDSEDYKKVQEVIDQAYRDLESLGATLIDPVDIENLSLPGEISGDHYEFESAINSYLSELPDAPYEPLGSILLSGKVAPWHSPIMMQAMGKTTDDPGHLHFLHKREELRLSVLRAMADASLDAIVYPTFSHQPALIGPDVLTSPDPDDDYGWGDNRELSPSIGFPALTVPAGFTSDGLPVGLELLGRPFTEAMLLAFGYSYEQATQHRRPPRGLPSLNPH